jgi:exodeoxyribonuclease-5
MEWSPQQDKALRAVKKWIVDPHAPQVFRLFGFAGTGKTTLAQELASDVKGEVLFGAFTGKASLVLRKKGCIGASTLHSMIYKPVEDPITGETEFKLNPDSPVATAAALFVDEVSMVGEDLGRDVASFGTKILVLGDPFQLPPISGEGFFTAQEPDILLTEIHRQAQDNPIIRMSMDVREGRVLTPGRYGESRVLTRAELSTEDVLEADQVLVGRNRTRQTYNARIRQLKGLIGDGPVMGDRLVCLKNNRTKGLLNGGLWEPKRITHGGPPKVKMTVASLDDPESIIPVDVETPIEFFRGTEEELPWPAKKRADQFTFGWALTCHKSQGSQWDHVFINDESSVFREHADKWLYTAITRAAERVTVLQS